jgi:beta-phosphoglucomutase-like phosphatase (HAD superfamily)
VKPEEASVFEDALAGMAAGRAGGFGFVVGVDRVGQADALREHGAGVGRAGARWPRLCDDRHGLRSGYTGIAS